MIWSAPHGARLRGLAKQRGVNQGALAEATGVSVPTIQRTFAGRREPSDAELATYAELLKVSVDRLLTGSDESDGRTVTAIPIQDIQVSAGPGRLALDEEPVGEWPFPSTWVREHFSTATLRIVRVSGDSQAPDLHDGDSVLIDLNHNQLRDGMHVVRLDDALLLKRVQQEGSRVRLKSANPSYDDIIVDLSADQDRFSVVARAVWAGKML